MNNLSKPLSTYYIVILLILLGQVLGTIYQGSVSLYHRHTLSQLKHQKQVLLSEKQQLNQQLSQSVSLAQLLQTTDLSEYETINQPLVISKPGSAVAASNFSTN
jgi:hypothetical protein